MSQTADQTLTLTRLAAARGARGYSLVELIVVMTIVGVVIGIAVPSYKYVTNSNRVASEVNQLLGDLQYARSEAVKEGSPVTVCPSTNATSSTPSCTGSTAWHTGWLVFSDFNGDGTFDSTADRVLRAQPGYNSTDTFVSNDATVTSVIFNREGFTRSIPTSDNAGGGVFIVLKTATTNLQWERCLSINYAGVMQVIHGGAAMGSTTCN